MATLRVDHLRAFVLPTSKIYLPLPNLLVHGTTIGRNAEIYDGAETVPRLPSASTMNPPHDMDCPECAEPVPPMSGSTWAIAWYSCGQCGTFWYTRLRVGPDADDSFGRPMIAGATASRSKAARPAWTIEELEAEAAALRQESETLPQGDLEALRLHLEKLKVLADAINQRLDARATVN